MKRQRSTIRVTGRSIHFSGPAADALFRAMAGLPPKELDPNHPDNQRVDLACGASATVSSDAPPEAIAALDAMAQSAIDAAKKGKI